ncbi:MAG: mevalonate kinase [Crocinitomicaceae bacterium]|nr:mevalonate kinase [Crocinitomicaceae bacterium]
MEKVDQTFMSKILLFGEYSLIHDSMALSIPYDGFQGDLTFVPKILVGEKGKISNQHLAEYAEFIRKEVDAGSFPFEFDIDEFEKDVKNGIVFDSNIPQGFGVGSSGALIAVLYSTYAKEPISNEQQNTEKEMATLKSHFAYMESYFHGVSSGMDPLICYLNKPVLLEGKQNLNSVGLPEFKADSKRAIFLIDTGKPGKTQPLVNLFLEKCKEEGYIKSIKEELIPFNNSCIKSFLKGEATEMFSNLKELSRYLLSNLTPMIPEQFHKVWEKGIQTGSYYLKLCGSGGGGFILGFTEDIEKAKNELKDYSLKVVHQF